MTTGSVNRVRGDMVGSGMSAPRQPLISDQFVVLRAPTQAWSARDGSMGSNPLHGVYFGDVRVISGHTITVDGATPEPIATNPVSASAVQLTSLLRQLDGAGADPDVRLELHRAVDLDSISETITVSSRLERPLSLELRVAIDLDSSSMDAIKHGTRSDASGVTVDIDPGDGTLLDGASLDGGSWSSGPEADLVLTWTVEVPARGTGGASWSARFVDEGAVVHGVSTPVPWKRPDPTGDDRLDRWLARALGDLDALRMTAAAASTSGDRVPEFIAAGAPWFFTLFGRDSIWTARMLLPLGVRVAADTLRVLAELQGSKRDVETAEQPGKIMHELRRAAITVGDFDLPPLYYGSVDATPLWICLLHDAWRWGMPRAEVEALLPNLEAALGWMRDFGDADQDGLLEYIDESGHGLANQGWKDSGDSVQWRDGSLATGPIALCEVQAYAFEAAVHGADLLDAFGRDGGPWRAWAARLRDAFAAKFWIDDPAGAYPAIALDAEKRPVDTVTSNLGHLLGTGLLDAAQSALVAARLASPELDSGYGLRTMSSDSSGYWPLGYHAGSVWAHDTAIAVAGLRADGRVGAAASLSEGLVRAAVGFDYRMPELHSGDADQLVPYPAACRPQAWSAAAAVTLAQSWRDYP
jgi:hypothetical protein